MSSEIARTLVEIEDLDELARGFSGRVIRPSEGVLLEDRHLRLEDVDSLARALIEKSEGRLEVRLKRSRSHRWDHDLRRTPVRETDRSRTAGVRLTPARPEPG